MRSSRVSRCAFVRYVSSRVREFQRSSKCGIRHPTREEQLLTNLHGAWHAWTQHPLRARGSSLLLICTERGMSGRERARALSEDAWMRVLASWAFGFYGTVPREAHARLKNARVKTKTHTPRRVCAAERLTIMNE
jgi:hypothetical protein